LSQDTKERENKATITIKNFFILQLFILNILNYSPMI
jgi:hypothetical protein